MLEMLKKGFGVLIAVLALSAWGQSYPNRAVRIIVPAGTGGPDIVARVVAAQLQTQLGQPFVVENRPGANGIIGADVVAKAPPDGYTLMVYSSGFVINKFVHKTLPYDTEKDFVPVTNLVSSGADAAGVPRAGSQAGEPAQLQHPGRRQHLAPRHGAFNVVAGTKLQHIPYKGGGPATAALAAGEVQAMVASPAPLLPHYKSGRVRVLGYTGATRHPGAPDVPTTAEAGLPKYDVDGGWFGMFAPANTPATVVDKLYREVKTAVETPATRDKLLGLGVWPVGNSPAEFRKFFEDELRIHAGMVRMAGLKPE